MKPISIEFLNYGKLTVGDNHRVPSSEGYGVTRRSKGLANIPEVMFLPAALLGIKKFDRDMIDEAARKQGGFFVRTVANGSSKVVIMRARFRPEDGEEGTGRMYQQTAVWVLSPDDWADNPAGILAEASGSLTARPDLLEEPSRSRMDADPLKPAIAPRSDTGTPLSTGAKMILNMLLPSVLQGDDGDTSEDRGVFFGQGDFPDEAAFLAAVGEALAELGPGFGRWNEISCASGIRCECRGLFIRYLPSDVPQGLVEISERSIRERLARVGSTRARVQAADGETNSSSPTKEITFATLKSSTSVAATKISAASQAAPTALTPDAAPGNGAAPGMPQDPFRATLDDYRRRPSADTANALLQGTAALLQSSGGSTASLADKLQGIASSEWHVLQNLLRLLHQKLNPVALGGLMDLALLFDRPEQPPGFREQAGCVLAELHERVSALKVLLPQELDLLAQSNLFRPDTRSPAVSAVIDESELLREWFNVAKANPDRSLNPDRHIANLLRSLGERLPGIFTEPFRVSGPDNSNTGIHGRFLVTPQAILGPAEYGSAANLLIFAVVPQYISSLQPGG